MMRSASPRLSWGVLFSPFAAALAVAVALAALAAACSGFGASGAGGGAAADAPSIISHAARVGADNGQIVFVDVALSAPGRVAVEYENEFAGKFRTALSETAAEHAVPVVRLRANAVYRYAVGVEKESGAFAYQARGEFETGGLPGVLATMLSETSGESSLSLIVSDYYAQFINGRKEQYIVMMDALGHIVWHYAVGENPASDSALQGVRVQPNGDIMYIVRGCCVRRVTPLGDTVSEIAIPPENDWPHHDFLSLEDGRLLYPGWYPFSFDDSANGGDAETTARVDTLNLRDPATGGIERVWDPTDFWDIRDPSQRGAGGNWLHINSLWRTADGGYLLSLRNIDQVVSLSSDFNTVRWRLGGPHSDFDFPDPSDRFARQHAASELPNGNILLFDNQARLPAEEGGGMHSRALELRLDFERKTAVKAWEFSPEPRMYAELVSSARRLDNGNTLVNIGHSEDFAAIPIAIIETDAQGREAFRLVSIDQPAAEALEKGPQRYRALAGPESIMGETTLRGPKRR